MAPDFERCGANESLVQIRAGAIHPPTNKGDAGFGSVQP
jgi:hypothetical protein